MKILLVDRESYAITHREFTDNGYLKVPGRVARTGIQRYLAAELGLTDREPNAIVAVYRPPEEVFAPESLASYDNADVTNDHPSDLVNPKTFKQVVVGQVVSPGRRDGDYVVADLIIKDQEAIEAIEAGKTELSVGYLAEYAHEPGVTDSGEAYEFVQRRIAVNHVALVDRARAGRNARLFDRQPKEAITMHQVVLDNGSAVEVADKATAQLIQSTIDSLRKRAADAEAETAKAKDEAEAAKAKAEKLAEDLEEERKKSSDAAIAERVKAVADTQALARKIAGAEFTCDSVDPVEIKRAALAKVRPTIDWADKSPAYVLAAFDLEAEKKESEDEEEEERKQAAADSLKNLGKDFKDGKPADAQAVRDSVYDEFLKTRYGKKEA